MHRNMLRHLAVYDYMRLVALVRNSWGDTMGTKKVLRASRSHVVVAVQIETRTMPTPCAIPIKWSSSLAHTNVVLCILSLFQTPVKGQDLSHKYDSLSTPSHLRVAHTEIMVYPMWGTMLRRATMNISPWYLASRKPRLQNIPALLFW